MFLQEMIVSNMDPMDPYGIPNDHQIDHLKKPFQRIPTWQVVFKLGHVSWGYG